MTEQTLIVLKPDAVERNLIGEIISRFEKKGFKVVKLKMLKFTKDMAEEFYSAHKEKPFFGELVSFIISERVVASVIEGDNVVAMTRTIIGATKPSEAAPGTIRGDFGVGITNNSIHASDSMESFEKEVKVVFE
ncbi:MAG: nucleoside-diphosphate kinase [Nitrosopumilaceae archaeon]